MTADIISDTVLAGLSLGLSLFLPLILGIWAVGILLKLKD